MASVDDIVEKMRRSPRGVSFKEPVRVCNHFFGKPRQLTGSRRIYRTPWQGEPWVNIQSDKGKAKPYQIRQILRAIAHLEEHDG